ncbi:malonyl-CoA decarboxylase [Litoreibacter sp.]|nr:malonyl-CoA decarboxylase [Litoreibacter sp.]
MSQASFLGDMLTTLFERRRALTRGTDARPLTEMCEALLASEGEVSGLTLATAILDRYGALDPDGKLAFFQFLNTDLEFDASLLCELAGQYAQTGTVDAYRALARGTEPRRQELLRRLNQSPGATATLVAMRADLLELLPQNPDLKRTDMDFVHLLRSWFNRGFLVLREISWDTPASILEKIVAYEAVHAINSWEELRRRLYPTDRRCYAYFHPTMPDEPLIFVEVALTRAVPNSIQTVLAETRVHRDTSQTSVAVFYSISNCQAGLHGISFGNLLIKQVVGELSQSLPHLETFVTLSPIPGLNHWRDTVEGAREIDDVDITPLAAHYLLNERSPKGGPLDPVARFHLGNGAQIYAVHAGADKTEKGLMQSGGAMVNYLYDLKMIEKNHETFVRGEAFPASKTVITAANAAKPMLNRTATP